ncbi:hypothetical protein TIFTF001_027896 [Ficus carica]|uniref:Wall-associated receptor kinase galacturonan-binding domain-containing protein n=1 Tax=Ficus carica TaxID=3494 RepID=A0AA88DP16_FICCA|nr:hypothetical protein TIFTF001_027896 [Ficus carica]
MARMLLQLSLAMVLLPLACNGGIGGDGDGSGGDGTVARPGCPDRCGNVSIPFPFGTKPDCYLDDDYLINCTTTNSNPAPTAFLRHGNIMVTNISLKGEVEIQKLIAKDCYDRNGTQGPLDSFEPRITLSTFTVSTRNKFTAIGCDTYAILKGFEGEKRYRTGCMSLCDKEEDVNYGTCNGAGCCQITSFPSGLRNVTLRLSSYYNHSYVHEFNPCSYAFIVEDGKFNFSKTSFQEMNKTETLPMILDWSIGNESCSEAPKRHNYTCYENSMCVNSTTRSGYLCQCLPGYQGNPYLPNGCKGDPLDLLCFLFLLRLFSKSPSELVV